MLSSLHLARFEGAASAARAPIGLTLLSAPAVPVAAVLLLAVAAPFEVPLTSLGTALTLTTLELAAIVAIALAMAGFAVTRGRLSWRTPLTAPAAAGLTILLLAAVLSPVDRGNALRFCGRMLAAAAIFVVTLNAIKTRDHARLVAAVLLALGAAISIVAVLEAAGVRPVLHALTTFRPGFHVVGGQLRATSTTFYPTIASMYLEVVFALGLWLLVDAGLRRRRLQAAAVFASLAAIGAGIIATFTRAGLIGMAAALAAVGVLQYAKTRRWQSCHTHFTALAAVMCAFVLVSRSPDVLLARLGTEGSQDWYGAAYSVPSTLRLATGREYRIPITVANTGRVVWDSSSDPMFALSYHWLRAESDAVVQFEGWRTPFPTPVEPNASATLRAQVRAPGTPGEYVLVWDVVHEHRAWLSTEGVTPARSLVRVEGERREETTTPMAALPGATRRPDRSVLWRAALAVAADYPLTGVGPDNFRHVYGRYAELPIWDTRVHANNMYLEVLAGAGVTGLAALLWLTAAAGAALIRRWHATAGERASAPSAMCAVWLVIAGHGLVDSFLSFTTTYVMFALAAGLAYSAGLAPEASADAHRL